MVLGDVVYYYCTINEDIEMLYHTVLLKRLAVRRVRNDAQKQDGLTMASRSNYVDQPQEVLLGNNMTVRYEEVDNSTVKHHSCL